MKIPYFQFRYNKYLENGATFVETKISVACEIFESIKLWQHCLRQIPSQLKETRRLEKICFTLRFVGIEQKWNLINSVNQTWNYWRSCLWMFIRIQCVNVKFVFLDRAADSRAFACWHAKADRAVLCARSGYITHRTALETCARPTLCSARYVFWYQLIIPIFTSFSHCNRSNLNTLRPSDVYMRQ